MNSDFSNITKLRREYAKIPAENRAADFNKKACSETYLRDAVLNGHPRALQWLFDKGVDWHDSEGVNDDLMGIAVDNGHAEVLDCLLYSAYPCGIKLRDVWLRAVFYGQTKVMDWLVGKVEWEHEKRALVFVAIMFSQFESLEWLETNGATLDEDATACAARSQLPNMLEWLLKRGVPWIKHDPEMRGWRNVDDCLAEHAERGAPSLALIVTRRSV